MHVKAFEVDLMREPSYRLQKLLYIYVSPVIVVVGLVGNIISLLVLSAPPMRRISTYCYLACLCCHLENRTTTRAQMLAIEII